MADATSLPTSLPQEQAAKTKILSLVSVQQKLVFSIMHSYFDILVSIFVYLDLSSRNVLLLCRKKGKNKTPHALGTLIMCALPLSFAINCEIYYNLLIMCI